MAAAEKPWLQALLASKKTCVVQDGKYKTSDNGFEVLLPSDNSKFSIALIYRDPCTYVRTLYGQCTVSGLLFYPSQCIRA